MAALFRIVQDEHPELPSAISPMLRHFLKQCFVRNPSKRPSATMLLRHPWIQSYSAATMDRRDDRDSVFEDDISIVKEWCDALKNVSPQLVSQYTAWGDAQSRDPRGRNVPASLSDSCPTNDCWARTKERCMSITSEIEASDSGYDFLASPPMSPMSSRSYSLTVMSDSEREDPHIPNSAHAPQPPVPAQSTSANFEKMFQKLHLTRQRSMTTPSTPTHYAPAIGEGRPSNRLSGLSSSS
ncbi:Protein kinase of the Mitotic Exit Network, partial [Spiromyces aspiralis]